MQTALGETGQVDVILNTKIYPQGKRPIANSPHLKAALRLAKGILREAVKTDHRQSIISAEDNPNIGVLEINVPPVDLSNTPSLPLSLEESQIELAQFLKPSVYIQADHSAIHAKAVEILDGETNSWKAAKKLCHWVHENVSDKNLQTGFGSSLQTLEFLGRGLHGAYGTFHCTGTLGRYSGAHLARESYFSEMRSITISGPRSTRVNG